MVVALLATCMVITSPVDSLESTLDVRPWRWSPYVAAGFGVPMGVRAELGYNIGDYAFVAMTLGRYGTWASEASTTLGLQAGARLPQPSGVTPYVSVGAGGSVRILGPSDEYYEALAGGIIALTPWLQIRPEVGVFYASTVVSSSGWFGSGGTVRQGRWYGCARAFVEVDIRPLFWP
jgi:hypothetical protein